jgi:DNA-binding MarR family transcriptional regulator
MTPAGAQALAATQAARYDVYREILEDWGAADRHQLGALLTRLNAELDAGTRVR